MKKAKKVVALGLTSLIGMSTILSACGGGKNSGTDTKAEQKAESTEKGAKEAGDSGALHLTFYYPVNVGGSAAALIEKICADFNAENKDIVVEPVYTGNYDDTVTKIQTAVQGGTPPDLFVSLATQRFTMASTGMAMPLDDLIASDADGKAYIDDFLPRFMEDYSVSEKYGNSLLQ